MIRPQLFSTPVVKMVDVHLVGDALSVMWLLSLAARVMLKHRTRIGLARISARTSERYPRIRVLPDPRHAVNDPMSFTEAAGQLFLFDVHHLDDIRNGHGSRCFLRREKLQVVDADFGVQVPADTVHLGQGQRPVEPIIEHAPEAFLKGLRVGIPPASRPGRSAGGPATPVRIYHPPWRTGSACG